MTPSSFGKRAAVSQTKSDTPQQSEERAYYISVNAILFGLVGVLIAAVAAYAGMNWAKTLSIVQPRLLEDYPVTSSTKRLFPYWDATQLDTKHIGNIAQTLLDFHALCGNKPAWDRWSRFYNELKLSAVDQDDLALYRTDRFDAFALRQDIQAQTARQKDSFCTREYWEAFFDARILVTLFLEGQSSPKVIAAKIDRDSTPTEKVDRRPLEPFYNLRDECSRKWRDSYSMQEFCIKQEEGAKSWSRTAAVDDDVRRNCAGKWPLSWSMYQFCANHEQQAKDRISR